jgi:cell division protein FtsZ
MINDNAVIKVVGLGTAGGTILENIMQDQIDVIDFVVANTDQRVMNMSSANTKILLTNDLMNYVAAGSSMELMRETRQFKELAASIAGSDLIVLLAGMGGLTGTNACLILAEIARSLGISTVGIVTIPFSHEGLHRLAKANDGIARLGKLLNSLVVMPNDQICAPVDKSIFDSFKSGDVIISGALRETIDHLMCNN